MAPAQSMPAPSPYWGDEILWDSRVNAHNPMMDDRIDDPDAGWKGRGLWASVSTRAPFHMEPGKGTTSKVFHFKIRPDPLAD